MSRLLLGLLLVGCTPDDADDTGRPPRDSAEDSATDSGEAEDTALGPEDMPADPSPWTLTTAGDARLTLVFDEPSCTRQGSNYRQFWRNGQGEHTFVLVAEILGDYQGAYSYSSANSRVVAKLQEEAGGEARYFASGDADEVLVDVLFDDTAVIWGEFTVSAMTAEGSITVSPQPLPVWCLEDA